MFARIKGMLLSPSLEFEAIAARPSSINELVLRYLIPLALLTPLATMVGMNQFDLAWDSNHGYRVAKVKIFNVGVANFAFEIVTVMLIGFIFFLLMTANRPRRNFVQAMNVAVYGSIPLMLSGILLFIPMNVVISMAAMIHSFILFWIGVQKVMQVDEQNASVFVAVSMTLLFGASSIMGAIAGKLGML